MINTKNDLTSKKCLPCEGGVEPMEIGEITQMLKKLNGWEYVNNCISKTYKFNDYHKQGNELGKRNTYAWWVIGLYIMSILDAYIDAHLSTFPTEKNKDQNEKKK